MFECVRVFSSSNDHRLSHTITKGKYFFTFAALYFFWDFWYIDVDVMNDALPDVPSSRQMSFHTALQKEAKTVTANKT